MEPVKNKRGRPRLGKLKTRISLTPGVMKVGRRKAASLGLDFSVFVESLIRNAVEAAK